MTAAHVEFVLKQSKNNYTNQILFILLPIINKFSFIMRIFFISSSCGFLQIHVAVL